MSATHRLSTIVGHLQPSHESNHQLNQQFTATKQKSDQDVVCVSAGRTALGGLAGTLSTLDVTELGAHAIRATLDRASIKPDQVQEVFFGNVLTAGVGQAPARQAALKAGLSVNTPCTTVNKVCASGMKALIFGAQSIQLGINDCVVVGGMESMSNTPFYLPGARQGYRMGHQKVIDGVIHDGLWDAYHNNHMGTCAEVCAQKHGITRQQQDAYAWESYSRAQAAVKAGHFKPEIIPISVTVKGKTTVVQSDEELSRAPASASVFDKLKPAFATTPTVANPVISKFDKATTGTGTGAPTIATTGTKPAGTVTAANASTISDGAAALVLMSRAKAQALGLKPLFRVLSYADAATSAIDFPTAPSLAIPPALKRAGLNISDIDLFELNEAFSVVALANGKILNLDPAKCNVWGGAVSIGHPIGCSGARIIVTLASQLSQLQKRYGVAAICNGGGGASAVVIERE